MEDYGRESSGGLRPISTPSMASRFPSLRRLGSSEPYRHRSLPAEPSPGESDGRASSEVTFAVLYDDGPDYHVGHMDDHGSMFSGHNRGDSGASYAPSFRTRDSRITSDEHLVDRNPDFVANQRLLAEGYLNNDTPYDPPNSRYPTQSEETLAMNHLHNTSPEKSRLSTRTPMDRATSNHSYDSFCTCDDDHDHGHGHGHSHGHGHGRSHGHQPGDDMKKDPFKSDIEAQNAPQTPTPFLSDKKGPPGGGPGGPGGGEDDEFLVCLITLTSLHVANTLSRSSSMVQKIHSTLKAGQQRRSGQQRLSWPPSPLFHHWPHLWLLQP